MLPKRRAPTDPKTSQKSPSVSKGLLEAQGIQHYLRPILRSMAALKVNNLLVLAALRKEPSRDFVAAKEAGASALIELSL